MDNGLFFLMLKELRYECIQYAVQRFVDKTDNSLFSQFSFPGNEIKEVLNNIFTSYLRVVIHNTVLALT